MAEIKLDIVNQALTAAGEETLTSMTPGTVMANAAIQHYDALVEEELETGTWKFASKSATPTLLTATADEPLKYQWQIPSEALAIQAVLYKNYALTGEFFEIEGRVIRCQYNSDITIKYSYRPADSTWPQRFKRIIVERLEAVFLRVTERHSEAAKRDQDADIKTKISRHSEARQRSNRPLGDGTIAQARLGGRYRRSV